MGQIDIEGAMVAQAVGGERVPNARCFVYHDGKDNLARLYADADLTDIQANPMVANANGEFGDCHTVDGVYRLVIETPRGALISRFDSVEIGVNELASASVTALAQQWAAEDEDMAVSSGLYSALHYAAKAAAAQVVAGTAQAAAEVAKTGAEVARTQAELAASTAGATIYASVAAGLAATSSGDVFLVSTTPGIKVYENAAGSESLLGWLREVLYDSAATVIASIDTGFAPDTIIRTRKDGFAYAVAASDASDQDVTTAGGVKLYALPGQDGSVSVKAFGAIGDGVTNDFAALQSMFDSGSTSMVVAGGTFNLGGGTLTLPALAQIHLGGGVLTNGTVVCDNNLISGGRGLSETITLQGTVGNESGVFFEWFTCEKADLADYSLFINATNTSFGIAPSISNANRTILKMLVKQGHAVRFGGGIYPFDDEIAITGEFYINGLSREKTLLWCPNSSFFHYFTGGATNPYIKNITIESGESIILTNAWSVNAIHGLILENSFFTSYTGHTFHNDYSQPGGTKCPIYGSKIVNCAVYAGGDKGCFYGWQSQSNVFDNMVDYHFFFNKVGTRHKGIPKAFFYNSSVKDFCNSNVSYSGLQYVFYADRPSYLFYFTAQDNVFENNTDSFQAICKVDAPGTNIYISTRNNVYVGVSKENGYHYILNCSNAYIEATDSPTPINTGVLRNFSDQYVRGVTGLIDGGGTKYRLHYSEPKSVSPNGTLSGPAYLLPASAALAKLVGMDDIYQADSANISFVEVRPSYRMVNSRKLTGGYGTTAVRPTFNVFIGYEYFDTTLGHAVWYNGTSWVDHAGNAV